MKWLSLCVPFLYFQRTRLNNFRALVFHSFYEWLPALLIGIFYAQSEVKLIPEILLSYLAFISMYEIGYVTNDYLANFRSNERTRDKVLSIIDIIIFSLIRITVFLAITWYLSQQLNSQWWLWYTTLLVTFAIHNTLKSVILKCVTFSTLAFIRFFSPFFTLIENEQLLIMSLSVLLNYVMFRLLTYMDSKNMLVNIDRKSDVFRIGFYVLLFPMTGILVVITRSNFPIWINIYYILINLIFITVNRISHNRLEHV